LLYPFPQTRLYLCMRVIAIFTDFFFLQAFLFSLPGLFARAALFESKTILDLRTLQREVSNLHVL
jgi:hypothetical protein